MVYRLSAICYLLFAICHLLFAIRQCRRQLLDFLGALETLNLDPAIECAPDALRLAAA
jgi:hypothetical protein